MAPDGRRDLEVWQGWIDAFKGRGILRIEANAASDRLQRNHPGWPEEHLRAVLDTVEDLRRSTVVERERMARVRERAEAEELRRHRDQLRHRWLELDEHRRSEITQAVAGAHPELSSWPGLLEVFCLEQIDH